MQIYSLNNRKFFCLVHEKIQRLNFFIGCFNVKPVENWLINLTYNFVMQSNESAHRKLGNLGMGHVVKFACFVCVFFSACGHCFPEKSETREPKKISWTEHRIFMSIAQERLVIYLHMMNYFNIINLM